jgi:hypothetical protein
MVNPGYRLRRVAVPGRRFVLFPLLALPNPKDTVLLLV